MKLSQLLGLPVLFAACAVQALDNAGSRDFTVEAWPLSSAKSQPLAQISFDSTSKYTKVNTFTPPKQPLTAEELVRVGFHDSADSKWRGVVTSAASFDPQYQQKLHLHLDEDGKVWHIAISTIPKPAPTKGQMVNGKRQPAQEAPQLVVEILPNMPAPSPILNRPIVLNAQGKVEGKEPEKSLLQK